jgi:hypothetical protein
LVVDASAHTSDGWVQYVTGLVLGDEVLDA